MYDINNYTNCRQHERSEFTGTFRNDAIAAAAAATDSSSVYHEQADARQDGSRHENSPRLFTSCLPMNIF